MKHTVKNGFHTHPVRINLIGVGGGGSLVLSGRTGSPPQTSGDSFLPHRKSG